MAISKKKDRSKFLFQFGNAIVRYHADDMLGLLFDIIKEDHLGNEEKKEEEKKDEEKKVFEPFKIFLIILEEKENLFQRPERHSSGSKARRLFQAIRRKPSQQICTYRIWKISRLFAKEYQRFT